MCVWVCVFWMMDRVTLRSLFCWLMLGGVDVAVAAAGSSSVEENSWEIAGEGNALAIDRLIQVLGTHSPLLQFIAFAHRHKKVYQSEEEALHRYHIFKHNLKYIEQTNARNLSYTLGINSFADLSWEEFKQKFLMKSSESVCVDNKPRSFIRRVAELPLQKDWRKYDVVSPVKDQGDCGSCWAFSTTGALESAHAIFTGELVLLSEQQLIDCGNSFDPINLNGCDGGWPSSALEYVKYNGGLDTEKFYPYNETDGSCNYNSKANGAKVHNVINITEGAEEELQRVVGLLQPVSVCFEVTMSFMFYNGGVYSSSHCQVNKPQNLNHAVLAVGYSEDENGTPYWIVKNSWGTSWGVDGYFHVELGKNMCGIALCATYPILENTFEAASS